MAVLSTQIRTTRSFTPSAAASVTSLTSITAAVIGRRVRSATR